VTVNLKSGFAAAKASAMADEIGSTVDEPETLMVPLTPAAGADAGGADAALEGASDAALDGAAEPPVPPEQAAMANDAVNASAPRRFAVVFNTSMIPPTFGAASGRRGLRSIWGGEGNWSLSDTSHRHRAWSTGRWCFVNAS
jgi:hypothetical protein